LFARLIFVALLLGVVVDRAIAAAAAGGAPPAPVVKLCMVGDPAVIVAMFARAESEHDIIIMIDNGECREEEH